MKNYLILLILLICSSKIVEAQDAANYDEEILIFSDSSDTIPNYDMPAIEVLGHKPHLLTDLPGTATFISTKRLENLQALTGNEVLRTVSGVYVADEEGAGLRLNIGIRGLEPDRSSRVLVLEDGIPVALNPYGEPQMYYTPVVDRMAAIEVLKGSGQILFGPQTIGGVINYVTADPPEKSAGTVQISAGQDGYFTGQFNYGNTLGNTGFIVNLLRRQANELGQTEFRQNDLTGKVKFRVSKKSNVGLKLSFYDELSNSTYIGLTQTMYDAGGQDYVRMAPDDRLEVQRIGASLIHDYHASLHFNIKTTVFGYTTTRNWQRQDFKSSPVADTTGVVWGQPGIPGGAIYMLYSNGHRNRQFEVGGIEPRFSLLYGTARLSELQGGVRFLYERAFEQRLNGHSKDARSGDLKNDEIRTGLAYSAFLQNRWQILDNISLSAGARLEVYDYERAVYRSNYKDTAIISNNSITALIPGAGLNYTPSPNITLFAGLHRGFAPPRIKDAITNNGTVYNVEPELSWNTEVGMRYFDAGWLSMEVAGFYMAFSNQIIPISESSGGSGSGLVNGGSTRHYGVEAAFTLNLGDKLFGDGTALDINTNFTYVNAEYNEDRFVKTGEETVNIKGNRTPYAPEYLAFLSLAYEAPFGLGLQVISNYSGDHFTDELNTRTPTPNGRTGLIEAYYTFDATAFYRVKAWNTRFGLTVKNLTDERYIATRRPQGIRVGLPRFVKASVAWHF